MTYLSLFSGIEAATVAWHPLGWTPVGFAEIDPFASAVLAHHYPGVPNFGDVTKHKEWPVEPGSFGVLVGGSPCQAFSVAGLRKGMDDPRGDLTLTYLAAVEYFRPVWLVWENVPGVLSIDDGRVFGSVLGALGELGYGFAYRVLDAQYVRVESHARAVPQRRRRVFVVGCLGDWRRAAAVLFERESLSRNPPPRRTEGEGIAGDVAPCIGASGRGFERAGDPRGQNAIVRASSVSPTLNTAWADRSAGSTAQEWDSERGGRFITIAPPEVAWALQERDSKGVDSDTKPGHLIVSHPLRADAGSLSPTLRSMNHSDSHANAGGQVAIAFKPGQGAKSRSLGESEASPTLESAMGGNNKPAVAGSFGVRRLTPRECERIQGFPDDYTSVPFRGKLAADGPRYRALGNSMAVNVMRWIGERIRIVDSIPGGGE